jgi:hypothetical protein
MTVAGALQIERVRLTGDLRVNYCCLCIRLYVHKRCTGLAKACMEKDGLVRSRDTVDVAGLVTN